PPVVRAGLLSWPAVTSRAGRSRNAPARMPRGAKTSSSAAGHRLGMGPAIPRLAVSGPPTLAAASVRPTAAAFGFTAEALPSGAPAVWLCAARAPGLRGAETRPDPDAPRPDLTPLFDFDRGRLVERYPVCPAPDPERRLSSGAPVRLGLIGSASRSCKSSSM